MAEDENKAALIINCASYERVTFALDVAAAAASLGRDVRILFTRGGVVRLARGIVDSVGDETEEWLRETIRSGIAKGSMPLVSDLLGTIKKLGAKIYACPAAMVLHNLILKDLVDEVDEVRSIVRFITEDMKDAQLIYV